MALRIPARTAQYILHADFTFNFDDTMKDINGVVRDFKTVAAPMVADVIPLPPGAYILDGFVTTDKAVTGATAYNVSLGDSANPARYLAATDRLGAGDTPLVPTGYVGNGENLRLTVAPTVADAIGGQVTVRVSYVINGRANETMIA